MWVLIIWTFLLKKGVDLGPCYIGDHSWLSFSNHKINRCNLIIYTYWDLYFFFFWIFVLLVVCVWSWSSDDKRLIVQLCNQNPIMQWQSEPVTDRSPFHLDQGPTHPMYHQTLNWRKLWCNSSIVPPLHPIIGSQIINHLSGSNDWMQ